MEQSLPKRCQLDTSVGKRPPSSAREPGRVLHDGKRSRRSKRFLSLSLGFWSGESRARAWLLTIAVLFFLFFNLGAALAVNLWNKFFFDALEQKDAKAVLFGIGLVLALAFCSAVGSVGLLHARMRLQVRWRQWFAQTLINRWLAEGKLRARIDRVLPLAQTAEAHRLQEENTIGKQGTLAGKIVLKP